MNANHFVTEFYIEVTRAQTLDEYVKAIRYIVSLNNKTVRTTLIQGESPDKPGTTINEILASSSDVADQALLAYARALAAMADYQLYSQKFSTRLHHMRDQQMIIRKLLQFNGPVIGQAASHPDSALREKQQALIKRFNNPNG